MQSLHIAERKGGCRFIDIDEIVDHQHLYFLIIYILYKVGTFSDLAGRMVNAIRKPTVFARDASKHGGTGFMHSHN